MKVNPEDYDPEELRQMAEERRAPDRGEGRSRNGDDPARRRADGSRTGADGTDGWQFGGGRSRSSMESPREREERPRGNPRPAQGAASDALRTNQLEQLFLHQSAMASAEMTKPYLTTLPQKYAAERVVFDWLEFLVLKAGFKRTMDAIRYYRTIDWITEDVAASLQDYLIGFSDGGSDTQDLDVDDHQLSLVYVARLASLS
jgi:archaellum component FlaD/FlaE